MRTSLIEANNIMDAVKPCRPRTEAERIRNIQYPRILNPKHLDFRYERDFQFRYWLANSKFNVF